jgi:hypothetical protein
MMVRPGYLAWDCGRSAAGMRAGLIAVKPWRRGDAGTSVAA